MDLKEIGLQSWWKILKQLPYDEGPSSTRWVYIGSASTVGFVLVMMAGAFCWGFIQGKDAVVLGVMATAVGGTVAALLGYATNAQNTKHKIESSSDPKQEG